MSLNMITPLRYLLNNLRLVMITLQMLLYMSLIRNWCTYDNKEKCSVREDSLIVNKELVIVGENILTSNDDVRAHYNKTVSIIRKLIEIVSSTTSLVTQS